MVQSQVQDPVLSSFFFQRSKPFHQATFAPGGVVPVNNAFFGGLIQGADGQKCDSASFLQAAILNQVFGFPDECACPPAVHTVAQAPLFVLLVAFDS
jgi:hypothetical protein